MERMASRSLDVTQKGPYASVLLGALLLFVLTRLGRRAPSTTKRRTAADDALAIGKRPSCILIASRNGGAQLASTAGAARAQCPVFVVSDGSTDDTAALARAAGAEVLELTENIGKPAAITRALRHFDIAE